MQNDTEKPHFVGHRQRLKQRFLYAPHSSLPDYEILELVLFSAISRKDVKPLAKTLLKEFGTIAGVVNASRDRLLSVDGVKEMVYTNFALIREMISRTLKQDVMHQNFLGSWAVLLDYLKGAMGDVKTEQFRILFLNKKNILIADELQTVGTIDRNPVYPREVVKRALFHEASAIILAHNHPRGNPSPSNADIELTSLIVTACSAVSVSVYDHVMIITKNKSCSFKLNLLI